MAFFDSLLGLVGGERQAPKDERLRLAEAWGVAANDDAHPEFPDAVPAAADAAEMAAPVEPGAFDIDQWRKKLKRVLAKLPASEPEWAPMIVEARSLNLGDDWVRTVQVEEFSLLIRRAVADGRVTPEEHAGLDLAHRLIGLDDAEAEALLHAVVAEAEEFFGKPIDGA